MDNDEFFKQAFIEGMLADDLCKYLGIDRALYGSTYEQLKTERAEEVSLIKRIRTLYNNKKHSYPENFDFKSFGAFLDW